MNYFIYSRATGLFQLETQSEWVLSMFPSKDYSVIISHHGY